MDYQYKELTEKIIGAFYDVYNGLGYGFLEKVYENALAIELKHIGQKLNSKNEFWYAIEVRSLAIIMLTWLLMTP